MTAILGCIALNGKPVDPQVFQQALDGLRPGRCLRSDAFVEGRSGLGHHASTLTNSAPQPMQAGPLSIVADAVLYNREDLAQALDVSTQSLSDVGLVLKAYSRWGSECLLRMNGDFAFAIHDAARSEVFLARDHIGVRPLYWTYRGGEVLFATLLKGLSGFTDLDWPISEARIGRYLCDPLDNQSGSFL